MSKAVVRRCSVKKVFLKISVCNFIKKEALTRCFPVDSVKFLRTPFIIEHLRWLLLTCAGVSFEYEITEAPVQVFSSEFCEILKNTDFVEHLRTVASETYIMTVNC